MLAVMGSDPLPAFAGAVCRSYRQWYLTPFRVEDGEQKVYS